ncbi:MAG TPA: hypothetical protein VIW71_18445 [Streptomyces sp.]
MASADAVEQRRGGDRYGGGGALFHALPAEAAGAADLHPHPFPFPGGVLAALGGVPLAAGEPEQCDQAGRLVDVLLDGVRHSAPKPVGPPRPRPNAAATGVG